MVFKIFLDANILLDVTLERPGKQAAVAIIESGITNELQLHATPAVIHVTSYFTAQYYTKEQTKKAILLLLDHVKIIDCDHSTALIALSSGIEDVEDALQYYTALKHDIDYFISSDKKLKKAALPQLPVYTAAELVKELLQK